MSRLHRFSFVVCLVLLAVALAAPAAVAQTESPDPFTYVAEWTIARDQWQGYSEWSVRNHQPILERLAADGTLLDWGFYETFVHTEGGNTHGAWWTAATLADIEKTRAALLRAPMHPAAAAGAHRDYLLRAMFGARHSGATSGGYLYVNTQEVRPGEGKAWREMWEKYSKPVLDGLVADGSLAGYAVHAEDVHTAPNTLRFVATISTSPEADARIEAAFDAARAKRTEDEQQALGKLVRDVTVPESHRDYMARITAAWFK